MRARNGSKVSVSGRIKKDKRCDFFFQAEDGIRDRDG